MGIEIIDILKRQLNLTSKELSEKSGVPLGTLNKILNGTTKDPKLETLKAISKVLGCSLDDFDDNNKTDKLKVLTNDFNKLNDFGKEEAIKRVSELTEIQKYISKTNLNSKPVIESTPYLVAAHDDNLTDEEKDVMNSRINEALKKMK